MSYTIYFAHGKESGPKGIKIIELSKIAERYGIEVISPDYTYTYDPDERVEKLLSVCNIKSENLILLGSSMGGYVSAVASKMLKPKAMFLMAPAFYIGDYKEQNPVPYTENLTIVHGFKDNIVPYENSVKFAAKHDATLHLINSGHTLNDSLDLLKKLFNIFLSDLY
jgi:predicted esterase